MRTSRRIMNKDMKKKILRVTIEKEILRTVLMMRTYKTLEIRLEIICLCLEALNNHGNPSMVTSQSRTFNPKRRTMDRKLIIAKECHRTQNPLFRRAGLLNLKSRNLTTMMIIPHNLQMKTISMRMETTSIFLKKRKTSSILGSKMMST
jgi:hypothetical protein